MVRYSGRRRTRAARGKRSRRRSPTAAGPKASLLLRDCDGQLPAPLAPTAANHFTPRARLHALAKTVRAFSALAVRLKGPLHDVLRKYRWAAGQKMRRKG